MKLYNEEPIEILLKIWVENNTEEWPEDTIEVIGSVLEKRGVSLPPQISKKYETAYPDTDGIISKYNKTTFVDDFLPSVSHRKRGLCKLLLGILAPALVFGCFALVLSSGVVGEKTLTSIIGLPFLISLIFGVYCFLVGLYETAINEPFLTYDRWWAELTPLGQLGATIIVVPVFIACGLGVVFLLMKLMRI